MMQDKRGWQRWFYTTFYSSVKSKATWEPVLSPVQFSSASQLFQIIPQLPLVLRTHSGSWGLMRDCASPAVLFFLVIPLHGGLLRWQQFYAIWGFLPCWEKTQVSWLNLCATRRVQRAIVGLRKVAPSAHGWKSSSHCDSIPSLSSPLLSPPLHGVILN